MNTSADSKYYQGKSVVDPIPNLRHEGSNLKRKPKGFRAQAGDMRTADNKYYRAEADTFTEEQANVKTAVGSIVINESNIDTLVPTVAELLKTTAKLTIFCPKPLTSTVNLRLQLAVGQLALTEADLAKLDLRWTEVVPVVETLTPSPAVEEPKAEEPKAEEPKVDELKAEEPKVEDEND